MRETLLVIAAALFAFGLTAIGSFHFDDYALFSDPAITSPGGWIDVWGPVQTRPLTYFTFWLNYQLAGAYPLPFHLFDLALHTGACVLLFHVLRRLLPPPLALTSVLIFAVHPIQTEAVAYVFARGTLLCTLLSISSLYSWLRDRPWLALVCFAFALLAKEECAAFPLFLLALEWVHPERVRRQRLAAIAAMLALAVAAGVRVIYAASLFQGAGVGSGAGITPASYASFEGIAILRYLRLLVLPWGFSVDTDISGGVAWRAIAWAVVIAAAALAAKSWRSMRAGFFFLAGFILLSPSSTVFPANDLAADRRMYLPMIAFSPAIAFLIERWGREAVAIVLVALTLVSVRYSAVWHTDQSLWSEALAQSPNKIRPRIWLARSGTPSEALSILAEAQRIAPQNPEVASEQGRVLLELGRPAEALAAFGRALALTPGDAGAINNRGAALLALGQQDAARRDFERALGVNPCLYDARLNLQRLGGSPPAAQCRFTPAQETALRKR